MQNEAFWANCGNDNDNDNDDNNDNDNDDNNDHANGKPLISRQ